MYPLLARRFLRWTLARDALARGWWLVAALYLVVVADLSPSQLVLIGVFQSLTVVIAELPAGVLADAVSRRLTLLVAHIVMGSGMLLVALTQAFVPLVVANCLWGLGWALTSGADVAWITDELDRDDVIDQVLTAQARVGLVGTVIGIVLLGALAWVTTLAVAIGVAGLAMIGLGLGTVARWPETRYRAPGDRARIAAGWRIFQHSTAVARSDQVVAVMLVATFLINGAAQGFGRQYELRLVDVGLPSSLDPVLWFATIAIVAALAGAVALRVVEAHIDGHNVADRVYVAGCVAGTVGVLTFGLAPNTALVVSGALLVRGVSLPITRLASTVVVNRRATTESRATIHSLLSQAENLREVLLGLAIAVVATASLTASLLLSAGLVASAGAIAARNVRLAPDQ